MIDGTKTKDVIEAAKLHYNEKHYMMENGEHHITATFDV